MRRKAPPPVEDPGSQEEARARIVAAGAELLSKGGREALTTRAVAAAAGVQAPTLYRLFGDKDGLLEAVAEAVLRKYVQRKEAQPRREPLEDLRLGWDVNVAFGLQHPAIFHILSTDPQPGRISAASAAGVAVLRGKVQRLAKAGLLRVTEERAVQLIQAAGMGTILTLLGMPEKQRDLGLSAAAREAVIAAITRAAPVVEQPGAAGAAIALRASLDQSTGLSAGERLLLGELLDRLASH